jgi:hypothetical protein
MTLRLVQVLTSRGERLVAASDGIRARRIRNVSSIHTLARAAIAARSTLMSIVNAYGYDEDIDLRTALDERRILPPIDHEDSARLLLTGTGLTHLGSADARDRMHTRARAPDATDSMKMFRMGLEGGRPPEGETGVQPEWFYKGDGRSIVAPEHPLAAPDFALDGGEEAELAGIYLVSDDGTPHRLGFALANEFSDHVTERTNYLYLAHSKLRPAALGPELLVGELPTDIRGLVRIRRGTQTLWERQFLTGEANMAHSVRNLEHHHFKYALFRRPGDLHVHFFGTATLSFADAVRAQPGDVFEIEAPPFDLPLRNPLAIARSPAPPVAAL